MSLRRTPGAPQTVGMTKTLLLRPRRIDPSVRRAEAATEPEPVRQNEMAHTTCMRGGRGEEMKRCVAPFITRCIS